MIPVEKICFNRSQNKKEQEWYGSYVAAKQRCNYKKSRAYKYYGARGIRFDLCFWAVGVLWLRDNAHKMKKPSLDRIDSNGDYVFNNCRFIELSENSKDARKRQQTSWNKGKKHSKNHRDKISMALMGNKNQIKTHSDETKKKMSETAKKIWEKRRLNVEEENGK